MTVTPARLAFVTLWALAVASMVLHTVGVVLWGWEVLSLPYWIALSALFVVAVLGTVERHWGADS